MINPSSWANPSVRPSAPARPAGGNGGNVGGAAGGGGGGGGRPGGGGAGGFMSMGDLRGGGSKCRLLFFICERASHVQLSMPVVRLAARDHEG